VIRRIEFRGGPPGNPLLHALALAGGALVFAALVLFSLVAFVVVASVIALLAAIVGIRVWWSHRRAVRRASSMEPPAGAGHVIEGEYRRVATGGDSRRERGEPER
jgi:hypothetical protein